MSEALAMAILSHTCSKQIIQIPQDSRMLKSDISKLVKCGEKYPVERLFSQTLFP